MYVGTARGLRVEGLLAVGAADPLATRGRKGAGPAAATIPAEQRRQ